MLDEMESNTDNAQNRMAQESIRTKKVAKNSGMCKYYSTIVLLLIILIFLIIQFIQS